MERMKDLRCKEVINVNDGYRYGYVGDVIVDVCTGLIHYLIVPAEARAFGIFGCASEYIIPWKNVLKIGDDIIIVDVCTKECIHDCK